jgi:hypothetical protein
VTLDLSGYRAERLSLPLGGQQPDPLERGACRLLLDGYGYHWFRLDQ